MLDLDEIAKAIRETSIKDFSQLKYLFANDLLSEIRRLRAANRVLREALEWYSYACRYEWNSKDGIHGTTLIKDSGFKAREALARYPESEDGME